MKVLNLVKNIFHWLKLIKRFRSLDPSEFIVIPKKGVTYHHDNLITWNNSDFKNEPHFLQAYKKGLETALDAKILSGDYQLYWRIHVLCWFAKNMTHLDGDFCELGVNTGIFSKAIIEYTGLNSTNKVFHLLDTFKGLDEKYSSDEEIYKASKLNYTKKDLYEEVTNNFKHDNVRIIKGSVPESLIALEDKLFCFVSIDMNCVKPEVDALNFLWDKIVRGGVIILDDYGYPGYEKQKRAHDEFAKSKGTSVLSLPTCQGIILKY